jgi:hypothetical protein
MIAVSAPTPTRFDQDRAGQRTDSSADDRTADGTGGKATRRRTDDATDRRAFLRRRASGNAKRATDRTYQDQASHSILL